MHNGLARPADYSIFVTLLLEKLTKLNDNFNHYSGKNTELVMSKVSIC